MGQPFWKKNKEILSTNEYDKQVASTKRKDMVDGKMREIRTSPCQKGKFWKLRASRAKKK